MADIKQVSPAEVARQTRENFFRLFPRAQVTPRERTFQRGERGTSLSLLRHSRLLGLRWGAEGESKCLRCMAGWIMRPLSRC